MRLPFRFLLAAVLALTATAITQAQQFSNKNVFTFAPAPSDLKEVAKADADTKLGAKAEIKVRPNTSTELYLWVLNPTDDKDEFTVELKPKSAAAVRTKVTIPGNTWVRVRLPKPAPPAPAVPPPPAAPAAAPAPGQPPAPAPEPPPPGVELPFTKGEAVLTFRLLDKKGDEIKDDDGKVYGRNFPVALLAPTDYIKAPIATVTPGKGIVGVRMVVGQAPTFQLPGTAPIQLSIPLQDALKGATIGDGFYRRTLTFDPKNPADAVTTLTGTIINPNENTRIYVGVDGIDRAFPFLLNPLGKTPETQLLPNGRPAVRVSLVTVKATAIATQPVPRFPVLVEVDNPSATDSLQLRLQPVGSSKELAEIVKLDTLREIRVWLDPEGPTDGGLLISTKSRDWVKPLDLSHLRGKVEITGVLETKDQQVVSEPITVMVDATPPERIRFLPIQPKLEKGKPLPVAAIVSDPETDVVRAAFFLCKRLDEGKIPADAIKAEGEKSAKDPAVWATELKVPPEFRGHGIVGVVFYNQVGLANDPPIIQRVEIVDAPPKLPLGNIEGKVEFGGRPQPGVPVTLRDPDNKEKGSATTDDKGKFKIVNIAPGSYKLGALKKDSSYGAAGIASVNVEADKTAKVLIDLSKLKR